MNTDKPLGAGLILFGVAGIWMTLQLKVRTFNDDPGPQLFPVLGFTILIICGAGLLFLVKVSEKKSNFSADARKRLLRGMNMYGLFVLYSLGLWLVGYYVASPIMVYVFYHVIAGKRGRVVWKGIIYSAVVTVVVHLIFSVFLNTLLPVGILI